jgi:hypothetical protein
MPENKIQHYVSQFTLRHFSCDANKEIINVFDRKSSKIIYATAIKKQAQESYFYGVDLSLEKYLKAIEDKAAPVIKEIIETGKLPHKDEIEYKRLLHYIMLYAFRTKAASNKVEENLNDTFREFAKYDNELAKIDWDNLRLRHSEPSAFNLSYNLDNWVVGADLESCLLVNLTDVDFYISDNPLVIYNPFMRKRKKFWNANSLLDKGLILLFPLSPKLYLMLFDPGIYDILISEDLVGIDDFNDIYKLNLLQAVTGERFLYFPDSIGEDYLRKLASDAQQQMKNKFINQKILHPDTGKLSLFSYFLPHEIDFYFSFIRDGSYARSYDVSKELSHPRNQEIVDWVKEHTPKLT